MIPFAAPYLGEEEAQAAREAILSGWVTQGPRVADFERAFARYCGAEHAIAVSSCTGALHLALLALGIGPGDEVICPSLSFIATANAVLHSGAVPVFADCDSDTYNLDADAVDAVVTPRTKAILAVHQLGLPADLDRLSEIASRRGIALLEDAACALGSRYRDSLIGGYSEMACFSFHPRKVITTGEGGMITTNNTRLAERVRLLRQQGMNLSNAQRHAARRVVFEQYALVGYNYRMTDIQAAVGLEQLKKLDWILTRRRHLARRYSEGLAAHPWIRPPFVPSYAEPNFQSYAVQFAPGAPLPRDEIMQCLLRRQIATRRGVMLAHTEPAYAGHTRRGDLRRSEWASANSLLLPMYPAMREIDQDRVIDAILELETPGAAPSINLPHTSQATR